ncbi:TMEM165/GDT1 family protein [Hydrococcus rivularis]|uniref:TMEM165/GDT1 family protein n=1 Tax=Hydrococcus rivularis TaxID=1616834 RepID=UPI000AFA0FFB|nr:TMEM165/GDT1 family protein [Hydrococcus rivularis]
MTSIRSVQRERVEQTQAQVEPPCTIAESTEPRENRETWSFWTVFSSTFLTIFVAEIGDKTQLATLLMSAESQSPWIVFAGAAAALIATSLLGVLVGCWIARRLSPQTLNFAVALLLLLITGLLIGDVIS